MAVKVLLQLKGDSTGATTAVDEAETALTGLGTGVDWNSVGTSLGKKAGGMIKTGLIGAALAVGDWLADGLSEKLKTPEGAAASASIDTLTTELNGIRDKILQPIIDAIPPVVAALLPLVTMVSNLVTFLLPPLTAILGGLLVVFELVATAIVNVLQGISNVVDAVTGAVQDLQKFLQDVQKAIQDVIDGIVKFFLQIKTSIDGLLKPITDAVQPIIDLLNTIFGRSDTVPLPPDQYGPPAPGRSIGGLGSSRFLGGPSVVNVYTGADPRAVVHALRRYTGDNGDQGGLGGLARSFRGA